MSCDIVLHPNGQRGTGVNAFGTDFPFVKPSADIRYILADAYLSHDYEDVQVPLRVDWLYGMHVAFACESDTSSESGSSESGDPTPVHAADIRIVDANDVVVFDSTTADSYRLINFSPRLYIHEWRGDFTTCRIVQHVAARSEEAWFVPPATIHPENGILDARVSRLIPKRVTSLGTSVNPLLGESRIHLVAGYNMRIRNTGTTQVGLKRYTDVEISAAPGSGLGRYPGCSDISDLFIRTINGIGPTAKGSFFLDGDGCTFVRQPMLLENESPRIMSPTENTLRIGNDCTPCCECEDYVNTYKAFLKLYETWRALGERFTNLRDLLQENIDRWLAEKSCREDAIVKVHGMSSYSRVLDVVVGACNTSTECKTDLEFEIELEVLAGSPGTAYWDPRQTTIYAIGRGQRLRKSLTGDWPVFKATWDYFNPSFNVQLRTRFIFENSDPNAVIRVNGRLRAAGITIGADSKSYALEPDEEE